MLVLCKFLRLLVNTLTDDEKYSLLYTENLTLKTNSDTIISEMKDFFSIFL